MGFTTSCFIRKNTPELRKKLEKLGYMSMFSNANGICLATAAYIENYFSIMYGNSLSNKVSNIPTICLRATPKSVRSASVMSVMWEKWRFGKR